MITDNYNLSYMQQSRIKSFGNLINFRNLFISVILWGNIAGVFDFLCLHLSVYEIDSSLHFRTYFYSAFISLILSYWLLPKIPNKVHLLSAHYTKDAFSRR